MIKNIKTFIASLLLMVFAVPAFAQTEQPVEMATGLYQSGKIYVVVAVVAIIFVGIIAYLVMLDRKLSRLEKEINKEQKGKK
jgi:CcmD family protein